MEPMVRIPLTKRIITSTLAGIMVLAVVLGIYIMTQRQDNDNMEIISYAAALEAAESANPAQGIRDPDSEVRGVWIATVDNIDFPSESGLSAAQLRAELDDIVATVKKACLTSIYFQVRPTCDAFYDSAYFPLSTFLVKDQNSSFPEGFDPLAYLIEAAHAQDIDVHAWVNPLRVTFGTADNPAQDLEALGVNNPARKHPEWVESYADGKLYFNAGVPEVRKLIANGCAEIARNYDIDGIVFDDYFYPYPVSGAVFDDAAEYALYGGELSIEDWRRQNVNQMVEACYKAIKAVRESCVFGIAPFGIWQNDDGSNGGSDTNGFNAYSNLYADALAWIKGGYIDYISPQIYWQFSQSNARFDVLCRWWNAQCDGTGVDLIISHGAYRSGSWGSDTEIKTQIEYARSELTYKGSIFYGYAAIKADTENLMGQLQDAYSSNIVYTDIVPTGASVQIASPVEGSALTYDAIYILGSSDPGYPLYMDGVKLSRTKSGYFFAYVELESGVNTFTFTQNGVDTVYTVNKRSTASQTVYKSLGSFMLADLTPANDYNIEGGGAIAVSATAPSGSKVTATLNGVTVTLEQSTYPTGSDDYLAATYEGSMKLPTADSGKTVSLGAIVYKASRNGESAEAAGANVTINGATTICAVEVIRDDAELKVATDSWYYDDYTPAALGMRDNAVRLADGYYKLSMGGYISEDDVKVISDPVKNASWVVSATVSVTGDRTCLYIATKEHIPVNGYIDENGRFNVTLYNISTDIKTVKLNSNPLFSAAEITSGPQANSRRILLTLVDADNFYGFEYSYTDDGYTVISFRNPSTLSEGELPLLGKTIVVDAGHGGDETGAYTPILGYFEKDLNLRIALAAAEKLKALGANVLLTRSDDSTVKIADRLAYLIDVEPDLCVSVHLNSMSQSTDITTIRGLLGLYYSDSGRLLAKCVSAAAAESLNCYERSSAQQRLAMVRNPKFPSTLLEVGFLTCVEEFDTINSESGVNRSAQGICDGIIDYYEAQAQYIN